MNNTIENNMPNIIMNSNKNKNQNILNRNDLLIISIFFYLILNIQIICEEVEK